MKVIKPIHIFLMVFFAVYFIVALMPQNNEVFDELYYHSASIDTIHGLAANIEHPPLVKLIVGASILIGGDNWVAWRLPIICFALISLALTYLIAKRFLSERLSLFATGLVALSTIFMLVGSCAILDMPCLAFGLLGAYLALRGKYGLAGLAFGLSFLCKELAVVMFLATFIYLAVQKIGKYKLLWFGGIAACVAFFGMYLYDLIYASSSAVDISNPVIHLWVVVEYQLKLNGVTRAAMDCAWYPPWAWVSPFGENAFNPLKWISWENGWAWKAQPNIAVEYLIFPLLGVLPVMYWIKRHGIALLSWLWISASFLPWLLAGLFVKTEANFYIVYSVPFLAIGCAYLYSQIKNRKLRWVLATIQIALGIVCFLYFFPITLF